MQEDINKMAMQLVLEDDKTKKREISQKIIRKAYANGIYLSSIHDFYMARAKEEIKCFTVPAINLRTMTYDLARAIFRVANKLDAGAFIFEIAKSEMGYTHQPPSEYCGVVLAAAIKEGYKGAVFIQGDHFQANAKKFAEDKAKEIDSLKAIIKEALENGFYNIDIDSSTLVDLSKPELKEQQKDNYEVCAELTKFIRSIEPKGITVSVGGEIGEVGHKNSTPEDLNAFMSGYKQSLPESMIGISKISIQTGTSHGGVVLPDGSIAKVKLDFDTLKTISAIARIKYGMAGAVQHGASTLPDEAFNRFPQTETAEVHLATQFQNMVFDSTHFPSELKERVSDWVKTNAASERKQGDTEEQFIYKMRKKAAGPLKKDIMSLPVHSRDKIAHELEQKFEFLFRQLNVIETKKIVSKYVKLVKVENNNTNLQKDAVLDGLGDD